MNCRNCGAIVNENDKFCGVCGSPIIKEESKVIEPVVTNNVQMPNQNMDQVVNQPNQNQFQYQQQNYNQTNYNQANMNVNTKKKDNDTACLVCGILSLFTCWIGIALGIVAIVLGSKIKKTTGKTNPGYVCGIIAVSMYSLLILVYIAIIVFAVVLGV